MINKLYKKIFTIFLTSTIALYGFFLVNSQVPVANGTDIFFNIQQNVILPVLTAIANSLMNKLNNKIQQTIAGVGGKGPQFIQNWREEINSTESRGLDVFRTILGNTQLCPYLDKEIKEAFLADKYTGAQGNTQRTGAKVQACIQACVYKDISLSCLNKFGEDKNLCIVENTETCVSKCSKNENFQRCFNQGDDSCVQKIAACDESSDPLACFTQVANCGTQCVNTAIAGTDKKNIDANISSTVNKYNPAGQTSFSALSKCTLPNNFNPETFARNFTVQGGLDTFRKLLEPQNNKLGFLTFIADPTRKYQEYLTREAEKQERGVSAGFKAFRDAGSTVGSAAGSISGSGGSAPTPPEGLGGICAEEDGSLGTCSNGLSCIESTKNGHSNSAIAQCLECNSDNDCVARAGLYSTDTATFASTCNPNGQCVRGAGEPLGALCSASKSCAEGFKCSNSTSGTCILASAGECPDDEKVAGRCINLGGITTPGQILNAALGQSLGSQINRLLHINSWGDLVTALISIVGDRLTNFLNAKLADESVSTVSNGNQYAQQNPGTGVNDSNSNGVDAYNNLNECLSNCDTAGAAKCASKDLAQQSICENADRLTCYANCNADTQGNSVNKEQKRRLGDTCQGDQATTHPDLSYTPVAQNDEALGGANGASICAFSINRDPRQGCTPTPEDDCRQKVPLVCYKQNQACIQCVPDADENSDTECDIDFPEIIGVPNTKRICDTRFSNGTVKVGVCVREEGGNRDREACMDVSQCQEGLTCNGNHRCRPPNAVDAAISNGTASSSFDNELTILIVDTDPDTGDELCPNPINPSSCILGIDPDGTLDLDIIRNNEGAGLAVSEIVLEQTSGPAVGEVISIPFTNPPVGNLDSIAEDLETLGSGTEWKGSILGTNNQPISNIIYFRIIDTR